MGNYSKLIGSLLGGIAALAAGWGIPAELLGSEMLAGLQVLLVGIITYIFPANEPTA